MDSSDDDSTIDPIDWIRFQPRYPLKRGDRVIVCVMDFAVTATWRTGIVTGAPPRAEIDGHYSYPVRYRSMGERVMGYFDPLLYQVLYDTLRNRNRSRGDAQAS